MATRKDIQMAAMWKRVAMKCHKRNMKNWGPCAGEEHDPKMVSMFRGDLKDHITAANYLRKGEYVKAYRKWSDMDTAARDDIPNGVYDYLMKKSDEKRVVYF